MNIKLNLYNYNSEKKNKPFLQYSQTNFLGFPKYSMFFHNFAPLHVLVPSSPPLTS